MLSNRLEKGKWSEGRPIYKRIRGSWGVDILGFVNLALGDSKERFLSVEEGQNVWGISNQIGSGYGYGESGQATNSSTSATPWWYYSFFSDTDDWLEGSIIITCETPEVEA